MNLNPSEWMSSLSRFWHVQSWVSSASPCLSVFLCYLLSATHKWPSQWWIALQLADLTQKYLLDFLLFPPNSWFLYIFFFQQNVESLYMFICKSMLPFNGFRQYYAEFTTAAFSGIVLRAVSQSEMLLVNLLLSHFIVDFQETTAKNQFLTPNGTSFHLSHVLILCFFCQNPRREQWMSRSSVSHWVSDSVLGQLQRCHISRETWKEFS